MIPCTCPTCHEELEVTCANRCPNAHLGAVATEKPAALTTRVPSDPYRIGATRRAILDALAEGGKTLGQLRDITRCGPRVSVMLVCLQKERLVEQLPLPAGRKRGAVYQLVRRAA